MSYLLKNGRVSLFVIIVFFLSCEEERVLVNPHDSKTDPGFWAPTDLSAKQVEQNGNIVINKVELSWTDNASGEDGYAIDRKIANGAWKEKVGTVSEDVTSWIDSSFQLKVDNHYRVYGIASKNNSQPISAKIRPEIPAPAYLNLTQEGIDIIKLQWGDNSIGEDGFIIDRRIGDNSLEAKIAYIEQNVTEWRDTLSIDSLIGRPIVSYSYYLQTYSKTESEIGSEKISASITPKLPDAPDVIDVISVEYDLDKMTVKWEPLSENDSLSFILMYSESESGVKEQLKEITNRADTTYVLTDFDPTKENWFWVQITDYWERQHLGKGKSNTIDSPPITPTMYQITNDNGQYIISWIQNLESDFKRYVLFESSINNMSDKIEIFSTDDHTITSHTVSVAEGQYMYYQIMVEDGWGLQSLSGIRMLDSWIKFVKTFGGGDEDWGRSVEQTSDGGYIIAGYTRSLGSGDYDVWLIKTDSNGEQQWNQTFGESKGEKGNSVKETSDGGYIIVGNTESVPYESGISDVLLIKTDSQGNEEWSQSFGETEAGHGPYRTEYGYSVQQATDGGYILIGTKKEPNNNPSSNYDIWLIKADSNGNEEWNKVFGSNNHERGTSVQLTTDGGYILTGSKYYSTGLRDVWLIKTASDGNEEWNQTFGTEGDDIAFSVQQTSDGGYIVSGEISTGLVESSGMLLIKTNSNGNVTWLKEYLKANASGYSVQQTSDGGYIITGWREDTGDDYEVWLIKTDSGGNIEWDKGFGAISPSNRGDSVQQTSDGGYIITGNTYGSDADVLLIKTDSEGRKK